MKRSMTVGRRTIVTATAVALVWALSSPVQQAGAETTQTPWQNLTQSQLTAVWWQWAFSVPVSVSPLFDDTGVKAYNGQPYSDLLFLGGTFTVTELQNGTVIGEVTRSISVKQGTAFFFPLLNSEADNVAGGVPHLAGTAGAGVLSISELRALAASLVVGSTGLNSTLTPTDAKFKKATGPTQGLAYPRLQSPTFSFTLPATDNLYQYFGVNVSGTVSPAVADGYYSFISGTLAPGYYLLQFGGTSPSGSFIEAITYQITVTN
jgi:hypothetical protein